MTGATERPTAEPAPWPQVALAALAVSLLLAAHAASYLPFIADDALISLRYAERLLAGEGLTWSDGARVEGYSNLLWLLCCAALGLLGFDLIDAARALGIAAGSGTLVALLVAARRLGQLRAGVIAATALALCGTVAAWSVGGMEQPLVGLLLAWALTLCLPLAAAPAPPSSPRPLLLPGALLALLCWTRPDGALLAAAVGGGLLLAHGQRPASWRALLWLGALPTLAFLIQLGFRLAYYGAWVPNTALAKLAFNAQRMAVGARYVGLGLLWCAPLALGALVLALRGGGEDERAARAARCTRLVWVPFVAWGIYTVFIGGDIFPARRHLFPLLVTLALAAIVGLAALGRSRGTLGAAAVGLALLAVLQLLDRQNARARAERWEWTGQAMGLALQRAFGARRPLLAADAAGCLPYFSKLPALDMMGLNDRYLASHPPADFGYGWIGHELGDGDYVLDRRPDLVVFCPPPGSLAPCFRSGKEMVRDPRFPRFYRPMFLAVDRPRPTRAVLWIRAERGKLGIERSREQVVVPGYLFSAPPNAPATFDGAGELVTRIAAGTRGELRRLGLPRGRWSLAVRGPAVPRGVRAAARSSRSGSALVAGAPPLELRLGADEAVDLRIEAPSSAPVLLGRVVLTRGGG